MSIWGSLGRLAADIPAGYAKVELWEFITIFALVFALFLLIVGIFTAYFGTGKSRAIGGGLLVGGIVIGVAWVVLIIKGKIHLSAALHVVLINSALVLIAAVLGAIAAIGLFLVAIMKS